jgi:hypothetical protein
MMKNLAEKIDAYLNDELSQEERLAFEKMLRSDESLREEFDMYREIEMEMKSQNKYEKDAEALKTSLAKLNAEYFSNSTNTKTENIRESTPGNVRSRKTFKRMNSWTLLAIAACLIGVIFLITKNSPDKKVEETIVLADNKATVNKLYEEYFKPADLPDERAGPLSMVYDLYENHDYQAAYLASEDLDYSLVTRGANNDSAFIIPYTFFYRAQCLLMMGEPAKAIAELNQVMETDDTDLPKTSVKWYLALAYLKIGNISQSTKLFKEVSLDTAHPEHRNANLILTQLTNN